MLSIVIPVHHTEDPIKIIRTIEGLNETIEINPYTITIVGTLPKEFSINNLTTLTTSHYVKFIQTDLMLGDAKNLGARYSIDNYKPDILVFMDAHINFFDNESKNWDKIIRNYLGKQIDHIVSPAVSLYDKPWQRGFGVISEVTEDNITFDLKWKWWGNPQSDNRPFEVPGLCGCFMAMTPRTFEDTICGYTPPLAIDDREFSLRAWTLGKTLVSLPELTVGHRFSSGYTDFTKKRSIEWGMGMLLYVYLNMDDQILEKLYKKGINATQNKEESLKLATSDYPMYPWKSLRDLFKVLRVRTTDQYFKRFSVKK